jgi:hypothetical protein
MAFYERREKRDKALNLRVTGSLKASLARLSKAWAFLDSLEEDAEPFEPEKFEPNESDVAVRLLVNSVAAAWKEIGGFEPKTDEEWERFYEIARTTLDKHKSARSK